MSTTSDRHARAQPGRRADYVRFLPLTLRLADNDIWGHVNNVHYYSLFDSTVCEFLIGQGILQPGSPELMVVVAESGCRYHSEIAFPERITGALRVARIGRTSVRYAVAVFREDGDIASAEGFMVHVCISAATRRPVPWPEAWRESLASSMIQD